MNPTLKYDLTIIVPVCNKRKNIALQETKLYDYLKKSSSKSACILFVMMYPQMKEIFRCGKYVADIMTFKTVK